MDNMSWLAALLVGVPEEFFFVVITCLVIGKRDFFSDRGNTIRTILATVLTTAVVVVVRRYSPYFLLNVSVLQLLCFIVTYNFVLKIQWHKAAIGYLLTLTACLIGELISIAILIKVTGISIEQCYANDLYRIAFSFPSRILQAIIVVVLYKLPVPLIDYGIIGRFTRGVARRIPVMMGSLAVLLFITAVTIKHFIFDLPMTEANFTNMCYILFNIAAAFIVIIIMASKFSKDIKKEQAEIIHDLHWFVTLCENHPRDTVKIIEIVKKVIKDGGYEI